MDKHMGIWTAKLLLIAVLEALCSLFTVPGVSAQGPQGSSIFVDCGSNASYVSPITNISWVPDTEYIKSGVNGYVPIAQTSYPNFSEFRNLRYFPDNSQLKNCYSFPVSPNQTYLVRGTFFYGYYDNATTLPSFQMGIDGTLVADVTFDDNATEFVYHEFSFVSTANLTFLCLLRDSSNSDPFISAISLSLLPEPDIFFDNYVAQLLYQGYYLETKHRINFGGNELVRSPDDIYDRYWFPQPSISTFLQSSNSAVQILTTNRSVGTGLYDDYTPEAVMSTALQTNAGVNMTISFPDTSSYRGILSIFFAELDPFANATSRIYYLQTTDDYTETINPFNGSFFQTYDDWFDNIAYTNGYNIFLYQDPTTPSPLGPLVNAVELLEVSGNKMAMLTNLQDARAIEAIKSNHTNLGNWTGDACVPTQYPWVTCSFPTNSAPLITEVNLADYNLSGPISPGFDNLLNLVYLRLQNNALNGWLPLLTQLTKLQELQLQNNFIFGELPPWLVQLPALSFLYVSNNNFSGPIPPNFIPNNSTWTFTYIPGNPLLASPTNPKSINIGIIIGPIIGGILIVGIIICVLVYVQTRNKHGKTTKTSGDVQMMKSSCQGAKSYSLVEVVVATNNFKTMIGKGGFGLVYYGKLEDGQEVAIKVLDVKSTQGPSEFFNEVDVLSRVSHRYLVSLIGYCNEDNQQMLIYEYMHRGSLCDHLYGDLAAMPIEQLDWKTRMNIVLNAAQGLDYLHSGSNQSIIHRDVKSSNILLSSGMEIAKVADFGLSRLIYGDDDITHVTTNVKGTAGYLDPEYFTTRCLSPKSDVYGFGVVLLEVISGRMPINTQLPNRKAWNLCEWVRSNLQVGNIDNILDPIVKASNPQLDALWKVAEIAIQCVEPKSIHRPTMTKVVEELRAAIFQEGNAPLSEYSQSNSYKIENEYEFQVEPFVPR